MIETQTAGMLPEAEIAFLDQVFLGSTAILNTLLSLLNAHVPPGLDRARGAAPGVHRRGVLTPR